MNSFLLVIRLVSVLGPILCDFYYCKILDYNTLMKLLSWFILSW